MAEHLLKIPDVGAGIVHQRGHRVPKDVHAPWLLDAGVDDILPEPLGEFRGPDALGTRTEEMRTSLRRRDRSHEEARAHVIEMAVRSLDRALTV